MSYGVDWIAKEVTIPTSDLTLVAGTHYSLDMPTFLAEIRRLEWEFTQGLWAPQIVDHANTRIDFAGTDYAPFDEIINGYTIQFSGVATRVDLLGSNNNLIDVLVITGVSVVPSNSAGLIGSKQILDQSYSEGIRIFIDVALGKAGTTPPLVTPGEPVNNLKDAQTIISTRNLPKRLHVTGGLVIGSGEDISNYNVLGEGSIRLTQVTFTAGCITTDAVFSGIDLKGAQGGRFVAFERCVATDLTAFEGGLVDSGIAGTITIVDTDGVDLVGFIDCFSLTTAGVAPIIDCNGLVDLDFTIKGYRGLLTLKNISDGSMNVDIDSDSIFLTLDSTCTAGKITVRGVGRIIDNSAGTTVNTDGFVEAERIRSTDRVVRNKMIINRSNNTIDFYTDDGLSLLFQVPIFEDEGGLIPVGPLSTKIDRRERIE